MWKQGQNTRIIASSLLFSKTKDERDTNCRNELLFKSPIMLRFSPPTRPLTTVQKFLFVIILLLFVRFRKITIGLFSPHFTPLNPSPSSTVIKSGNVSEYPMTFTVCKRLLQNVCIPFRIGLYF